MIWLKKHKLEVGIFFIALAVRLALFFVVFAHNGGNLINTIHGDDGYYEISQGILNGHGFTWDTAAPFHPNPLRPPVWPFLIALFAKMFGNYWAVFAFEIILGSLIPVLAFHVAARIFGPKVGKWTGILLCFEPYLVLFSFILYTETSFIFFFLLSIVFLLRYIEQQTLRGAVWFGAFLGLATLVKPTVEYVPILVPIALAWLWRKRLSRDHAKHLAAFALVFCAMIAPWIYRNHVEFGAWGMSAQPAYNLYVYLMPTVLAIDEHSNFDAEQEKHVLVGDFSSTDTITLSTSKYYADKATSVIMDHKVALAKSVLISLVTFFTHDGMLTVLGYSGVTIPNVLSGSALSLVAHPSELISALAHYAASPAIVIIIMRLFWIVVTIFLIFGSWRYFRAAGENKLLGIAALCFVLYFAATTAINGFGVNARFRMPVDAFILGFALYGFYSLRHTKNPLPDK